MKNALVLIDYQNDFCHKDGSLFVPGADADVNRICEFIRHQGDSIDKIFISLDSHQKMDIAHPTFWVDKDGNHPGPFTQITYDDMGNDKWTTTEFPSYETAIYLRRLEAKGSFAHVVWPEHCLIGSWGWELHSHIKETIENWGGNIEYIIKGTNPMSEHFGLFAAEMEYKNEPDTHLNKGVIYRLEDFDKIYISGEAESHCVAVSVKQMLKYGNFKEGQVIILSDSMSPVTGFETIADPIYKEAREKGFRFLRTVDDELHANTLG